jgi:hypothetical protein
MEPSAEARSRIAARELAAVVLVDKNFAPFAELAQSFRFASAPSLAGHRIQVTTYHKTADLHLPKYCLHPDIFRSKQKHFLPRAEIFRLSQIRRHTATRHDHGQVPVIRRGEREDRPSRRSSPA